MSGARPWHYINPNNHVTEEEKQNRISVCESCDKFTQTRQCSVCNCFMDIKAALNTATCPMGKWE